MPLNPAQHLSGALVASAAVAVGPLGTGAVVLHRLPGRGDAGGVRSVVACNLAGQEQAEREPSRIESATWLAPPPIAANSLTGQAV